jgi:quinol monooxygenase YgiN
VSIEKEQNHLEKTRLEELQEKIASAPGRIESEFARTGNSWLACFGSSVFVIETYLSSPKLERLLSPEQYQRAAQKLEELKDQLYRLKQQYPDRATMPPDDVKNELLRKLDIFREGE